MFGFIKRWRRKKIIRRGFPSEWEDILRRNVKLFERLPQGLRDELKRKVLVFLDEKHFEGCQGFAITDEVRVTVAANACLLLLNRRAGFCR